MPQQLKMYSQVLTISYKVEQILEKKRQDKIQKKSVKRPFWLVDGEDPARPIGAPISHMSSSTFPSAGNM